MNRNTVILIIILVALALGGYFFYRRHTAQAPTTNAAPTYVGPTSDKPSDIDQDLSNIDTGSKLESSIDASTSQDINQL